MQLGEPLEYVITFPTHSIDGGSVNLRCLGKVVRLDREGSNGGCTLIVGATLERYEFLRK
jgi:hypothetical protein